MKVFYLWEFQVEQHSHYMLTPLAGGDDLSKTLGSTYGFEKGKPSNPGFLSRLLRRFLPDTNHFSQSVPPSFPAAANVSAFTLNRLGTERLERLYDASPRLRSAMEAELENEWGIRPSATPAPEPALRKRKPFRMNQFRMNKR